MNQRTSNQTRCPGEGERVTLPDDGSAEALAKLAWAVAHPARVRIVQLSLDRTS